MDAITLQLQYEDWAFRHGFETEAQVSLATDFLWGLHNPYKPAETMLAPVRDESIGACVRKTFYDAGRKISMAKAKIESSDIVMALNNLFAKLVDEIKSTGVMNSTGDCRGACKYNTGDRSEYRNYGW